MERENKSKIRDSDLELFLFFIDEERNNDLEKRFNSYINIYFNFNKKDNSDISENTNKEIKENKENKNEIKVIKFVIC